jgi:ubiquinone biosynthesis protein Coq4
MGKVQVERYHLHVLKTKREVKHAVHYVAFNQQKHEKGTYTVIDEFTSAISDLKMVQEYAKRMKITMKIQGSTFLDMDRPRIFILAKFD